ncbi:MAG: hypothetical protein IH838_09565 [Proteobacteria bacterium]|nr:hypothetical protein [Pseudomonadota bacterium]
MMSKSTCSAVSVARASFIGTLVIGMSSISLADDSVVEELQRCAAVDEASSRLACYDHVSGRQDPVSVPAPATASAPVEPLPDELGSESLNREDDEEEEPTSVVARVTKCTKDITKKRYIFYLDSGQVWKQVSDKHLYFKDCGFSVTISKDFFGYKMQQEGEKSKFRVSRLR